MYEIVVVEIASPSTALKYFSELPDVSTEAKIITSVATTPERRLTTIGVPQRFEKTPSTTRRGAVVARDRLGAVGAHDPGRAARHQHPDEAERGDVAEYVPGAGQRRRAVGGDRAAVDGEDGLHRVDEAAEVRDLARRQHEQDHQHRDAVEEDRGGRGAQDRERHVPLRVDHLLARRVRQLEADEVEEQHRHRGDEDRVGRLERAGAEAVHAVLERVDQDRDREEREQDHPRERADRRDPLADVEREDRAPHREPDEAEQEHVAPRVAACRRCR